MVLRGEMFRDPTAGGWFELQNCYRANTSEVNIFYDNYKEAQGVVMIPVVSFLKILVLLTFLALKFPLMQYF